MSVAYFLIVAATLFLAYSNGANDNFKGVATLFGSGTANYRRALTWATLSTFLGSLAAFFLAQKLLKTFSGKGLVPEAVLGEPAFMMAVVWAAGFTVFLAARTGIPISTTHSLTGALAGAGFMSMGWGLGFEALGRKFFLPLLTSPFIALFLTAALYLILNRARRSLGVKKSTCVCIGEKLLPVGEFSARGPVLTPVAALGVPTLRVGEGPGCDSKTVEVYAGRFFGVSAQQILDGFHFLSAGAVSFARGLNDTPKIAAVLFTAGAIGLEWTIGGIACFVALGGILSARRVAETMSHKITPMNHGQGFTANFITSGVVIGASLLGSPVSTTHVSCGSLFGVGWVGGRANWKVVGGILSSWVLTLPVAASSAAFFYGLLRSGLGA